MPKFDVETAITSQAQGTNLMRSISNGFGAPPCMADLAEDVLAILPFPVLIGMHQAAQEAQEKVEAWIEEHLTDLNIGLGISVTITPNGEIQFTSRNSAFGAIAGGLGVLGAIAGYVQGIANFGAGLYKSGKAIADEVKAAKDCVEGFFNSEKLKGTNSTDIQANLTNAQYEALVESKFGHQLRLLRHARVNANLWDDFQGRIEDEMLLRQKDPNREPVFDRKHIAILSGTGFRIDTDPDEEPEEIFRLVFGPPIAREGQFLLSVDGLYYDSQSTEVSGVTKALDHLHAREAKLKPSEKWRFKHDPNIGGKGVSISDKSLNFYVNTIFDPDRIDDSRPLRKFYDSDHFLQVLMGQKEKRTLDLSGHINEFETGGASQAIIQNAKQSLYSEVALFAGKINKRKKQIEVAVKIPSIYGGGGLFKPGEIPVNDFTYLAKYNFVTDIHKQKALVLDHADVSGVILPLTPKYVISRANDDMANMDHLAVAEVGKGSIMYSSEASSTIAPKLNITDQITTEGLFAIYNYLESDVVTPSSTEYKVMNCATQDVYNNAQLVAREPSSVFVSGLGIPFLEGITRQVSSLSTQHHPAESYYASAVGSYVKLPATNEFQDLTYSREGFTFDTWMYVPHLTHRDNGWMSDNGASSLYRLILANENTGITSGIKVQPNSNRLYKDLGESTVRGMVMGFTRDNRITRAEDHVHHAEMTYNDPASSLSFFVAPTQSMNESQVGLIASSCITNSVPGWYHFKVDASSSDSNGNQFLLSACDKFVHMAFTVEPEEDEVRLHLNGKLMATSSLETCFGREKHDPIAVPSFKKDNSFNYSGTTDWGAEVGDVEFAKTVGASANELSGGPRVDPYFTPWILGGGYTDGIAGSGFFGAKNFGTISGFRGYLGSTKFYNKALDTNQISSNYEAQKTFFENIKTVRTYAPGGGPIIGEPTDPDPIPGT